MPPQVQKDIKIIFKYWSDETENVPEENSVQINNDDFIVVLSKSQRKKMKKKANQAAKAQNVRTRSRAGPSHFA